MPAGRMSAPASAGTLYKGREYDERVGDKGDRGAGRGREGEKRRKWVERGKSGPTLNYSKIRGSVANLLSLGERGGVISVKITLRSPRRPFNTFFPSFAACFFLSSVAASITHSSLSLGYVFRHLSSPSPFFPRVSRSNNRSNAGMNVITRVVRQEWWTHIVISRKRIEFFSDSPFLFHKWHKKLSQPYVCLIIVRSERQISETFILWNSLVILDL